MAVTDIVLHGADAPIRHAAALEIEPFWLLALFREMGRHGRIHQLHGLPDDARVVSIAANPGRNTITLYLESESFPECAPGFEPVWLHELTMTVFTLSPEQRSQLDEWISQ